MESGLARTLLAEAERGVEAEVFSVTADSSACVSFDHLGWTGYRTSLVSSTSRILGFPRKVRQTICGDHNDEFSSLMFYFHSRISFT